MGLRLSGASIGALMCIISLAIIFIQAALGGQVSDLDLVVAGVDSAALGLYFGLPKKYR